MIKNQFIQEPIYRVKSKRSNGNLRFLNKELNLVQKFKQKKKKKKKKKKKNNRFHCIFVNYAHLKLVQEENFFKQFYLVLKSINTVTFLPFKKVYIYEFVDCNQSKTKYVF